MDSGHVLHLRGANAATTERVLAKLGARAAVLGSNRSWTSFVPIEGDEIDAAALARLAKTTVLHVQFHDDAGVSLGFHGPDDWYGELSVPIDGSYELGDEDLQLLRSLVKRKVLSAARTKVLAGKLRGPSSRRDKWILQHGLETDLGVPQTTPLPWPRSERAPKRSAPKPKPIAAAPATGRTWSAAERAIVDLHIHYLTRLWSCNSWTLTNLYKRHLPAADRREVEDMIGTIAYDGDDEAGARAIASILTRIWEATDWGAVIRNPKLLETEPLDEDQLADWRKRLARAAQP